MSLTSELDQILGDAAQAGAVPGVVAVITDREQTLYEGAFGHRVLGGDAPMTTDTVGWIASCTKAVTGAACMQLVEQGRLDLDSPAQQWAPGLAGMNVLVGGEPAQHHDFIQVVYDEFPLLLVLSLLVTFVVLMLFFHSLVLPLVAIVMNIISLVVSLGLLVVVFQWGIGDNLLGFHSLGALEAYTPVLLFSVLFGLSTDYQVFLLTRVREQVRLGK